MGGKALLAKVPDLKRLSDYEYLQITREVVEKIKPALGLKNHQLTLIPSYSNKKTFGDADYIISSQVLPRNWRDIVSSALQSTAMEHTENSNVTSFEYKKFQIDIIEVDHSILNFSYNYFSYNDLGNLIGRIARAMGFKFGFDGLWLEVNEGTERLADICVTKDFYKALALLGFTSYNYGYGMRSLEDIYRFVISCKYFDKEVFLLENRNHRDRTRDSKRTTYMGFLEYIKDPKISSRYSFANAKATPWVNDLKKSHPNVIQEYFSVREFHRIGKMIKLKFNGEVVSSISKLEGKDLGDFMDFYKKSFKTKHDFDQFILSSTPETINNSIASSFTNWNALQVTA